MLLLAGDIHLNPGPGVIGAAQCVVSDSSAAPGDAPRSALHACGRARFGCNQAVVTEFLDVLSGISAKITTTTSDGRASVACYQDVLSDRIGGVSPTLGLDIAGLASIGETS
ncbi:hypothetical protein QQF64_034059 [Cirrhinus molitorella]|uniref:Uncharacterized protein n=1 Tax=Cirrhinus molitorella TaxID=172907 RepID=A0ABR3MVR6_9TELE